MINLSNVGGPWSMLDDLAGLQSDINRLLGGGAAGNRVAANPRLNIWTSEEEVVVDALLPGAEPSNVDISVEGDQLTISGNVKDPISGESEVKRREIPIRNFSRMVRLPFRVDTEKVRARYRNGLLRVKVPRAEEDKPRKIEVTTD